MKSVITSAPGKLILHGEHSVVAGKLAIAACLGLRTYVFLTPGLEAPCLYSLGCSFYNLDGTNCQWRLVDLEKLREKLMIEDKGEDLRGPRAPTVEQIELLKKFVQEKSEGTKGESETAIVALTSLIYLYLMICPREQRLQAAHLEVRSELPIGAGLGSSAAYSVAVAAALLASWGLVTTSDSSTSIETTGYNHIWTSEQCALINSWGFVAEKVIHGNPSGIDNAVASYGGAIRFQKGSMIPIGMPRLRMTITNTKVPRSTKALVSEVKRRQTLLPSVVNPMLDAMHNISEKMMLIFDEVKKNHYEIIPSHLMERLEMLIDMNQSLLNALGVGHASLDRLCAVTAKYGLHSKLTGAGGGGCAITLLRHDTPADIVDLLFKELKNEGYECWETAVGGYGVAQHATLPVWWTSE